MRYFLAAFLIFTLAHGPYDSPVQAASLMPTPVQSDSLDDGSKSLKEAERLARETAERLMDTLRLMLEYIPQYEMPEINEDGDIIIRRKRKTPDLEPDDSDSSRT